MELFPIVDHREDGPWTPSYELSCTCNLCGERHIAIFNKGTMPKPGIDECPHCECSGMLCYGHSKYARDMRAENAKAAQGNKQPALLPPGWVVFDNPGGM